MTLQFSAAGQLQHLSLGLPEIASALAIGKSIGSLFTRQSDASIFTVLEEKFEVRVLSVPPWLEDVKFTRATHLHGQNMRRIKGPTAMESTKIHSLEGLATFVVLCCRYTESVTNMVQILKELLLGKATPLVHPGQFSDSSALPHMVNSILATFVRATIDSDADSSQSRRARDLMAQLGFAVGMAPERPNMTDQVQQKSVDIVRALLGGSQCSQALRQEKETSVVKIFDTMYIGAATIALAASANGANVRLECISKSTRKDIPDSARTKFLARFWLCQPPAHIISLLVSTVERNPGDEHDPWRARSKEEYDESNIIFGGEMEIALNIAQRVGFVPRNGQTDKIMRMWKVGLQQGRALNWATKPFVRSREAVGATPHLSFVLQDKRPPLAVKSQVAHLAASIKDQDRRVEPIARRTAQLIDEEYLLTDYDDCHDKVEIQNGIQFVLIATAIGSLHTLVNNSEGDQSRYALNLDAISYPKSRGLAIGRAFVDSGAFSTLLALAIHQGVSHNEIILLAALLWGGASDHPWAYSAPNDRILGVVAPQCTIVLELIREPLLFATQGLRGNLLSIHRGSVPILPRHPQTGYVHASQLARRVKSCEIDCKVEGSGLPGRCSRELVITFEPDVLDGSMASIFCGWLAGELVLELDPLEVLSNLLIRRYDQTEIVTYPHVTSFYQQDTPVRHLSCQELAKRGRYYNDNGVIVLSTHADPAWLIAGAACIRRGNAVVQTGPLNLPKDGPLHLPNDEHKQLGHVIAIGETILHFQVRNPS